MSSDSKEITRLMKENREGFERAERIRQNLALQVKVDSGRASHVSGIVRIVDSILSQKAKKK